MGMLTTAKKWLIPFALGFVGYKFPLFEKVLYKIVLKLISTQVGSSGNEQSLYDKIKDYLPMAGTGFASHLITGVVLACVWFFFTRTKKNKLMKYFNAFLIGNAIYGVLYGLGISDITEELE